MDGFRFVLSGCARCCGESDRLLGEIGKHEGVFVPRDVPYWLESVGTFRESAADRTIAMGGAGRLVAPFGMALAREAHPVRKRNLARKAT